MLTRVIGHHTGRWTLDNTENLCDPAVREHDIPAAAEWYRTAAAESSRLMRGIGVSVCDSWLDAQREKWIDPEAIFDAATCAKLNAEEFTQQQRYIILCRQCNRPKDVAASYVGGHLHGLSASHVRNLNYAKLHAQHLNCCINSIIRDRRPWSTRIIITSVVTPAYSGTELRPLPDEIGSLVCVN